MALWLRLTSLPNFGWAFRESVVTSLCAASMSATGSLGNRIPLFAETGSNQNSGKMPANASFVTPRCVSNLPLAPSELGDSA